MNATIFSLLDTPAFGGAEQYLFDVLIDLQNDGHTVVLATNNSTVSRLAREKKLHAVELPYRLDAIGNWKGLVKYFVGLPTALLWCLWMIKSLQEMGNPIICLFPGFSDRLSFSPLVKWLGCKLIWLEYGPLEPTFSRNFGFPKLLYKLARPFPDEIVTISQWTKQSLVNSGKVQENRIRIIYPGVQVQAKRKVSAIPFRVTTLGRLATEKEMDLLLQAWSKCVLPAGAQLVIIGDGPEDSYLKKLTKTLKIDKTVEFTGFLSETEKARRLCESDLFVFPSAWKLEGFGMTTIEAMSWGVPVLTSGFGSQSEIIHDGENGWVFTPHTDRALARKIQQLLSNPRRKQIGLRGQETVRQQFTIEHVRASYSQLCEELLTL